MPEINTNRQLKVLVLPSWFPPDGGYFFLEHASNLCGDNIRVHILVNRLAGISKVSFAEYLTAERVIEISDGELKIIRSATRKLPGLEKQNLFRWKKRYIRLYNLYLQRFGKPDFLLVHSSLWAGLVASEIKRQTGVPYLLVEHRSRFAKNTADTKEFLHDWYLPLLQKAFGSADRIVTVSPALNEGICGIRPGIEDRISSIPNMVDTDFFVPPQKPRTRDPFIIQFIGILEPVKGIDTLLKAFAILVSRNKFITELRIAGRGSSQEKLKNLAASLSIQDRVIFSGYLNREQVRTAMQEASVFVLPSHFEAFGVVLIEAMSTACPVISSYAGGPEYIVNEKSGILVQPGMEEELAEALETLYNDYESYRQNEIRQIVLDRYTGEGIRKAYMNVFKELDDEQDSSEL